MQAKMACDRLFQDNLCHRLEQNLQDCTFTVISLLPTLCDPLLDSMNVEKLVQTLKEYRKSPIKGPSVMAHSETEISSEASLEASHSEMDSSSPMSNDRVHPIKSHMELWEEIKLQSFTCTLTALYCLDFLMVFVYLQLNLIGQYIYVDLVASLVHPQDSQDVCHDFINQTIQDVVSQVSLKAKLTYLELVGLVSKIHQQVEKEQGEWVALRTRFTSNQLPTSPKDLCQMLVYGGVDPSLLDDPFF
ncbi:peroxin [Dispira simplex]|nr:peroxin [Dispira simplex]